MATTIKLSERQEEIIKLVKENQPITSEVIAKKLGLSRSALRSDLAILTMTNYLEAKPKVGYIYKESYKKAADTSFINEITVEDVMSAPTIVSEDTTIYDAILYIFAKDCGTLFIENEGNLVGAVSRKDFIKMAMGSVDIHKVPVGIIMTRMPNIVYVYKQDKLFDAAKKIMEHQVDSLPVVEKAVADHKETFKIVGKISKTNITQMFVKMGESE